MKSLKPYNLGEKILVENCQKISITNYLRKAKEKLKKAGCEAKTIHEEIKKNPKMTGIKIL